MSRIYDIWERLVGAVLKREHFKRLALCESLSSTSRSASSGESDFSYYDMQVHPICLTEIMKATNNFLSTVYIGGGLCQVFKAWVDQHTLTASDPGLGMAVAIKIWDSNGHEKHQDWVKEIYHLTELCHPNLVELVGYWFDEGNMILVYKFLGNGSLYEHLFRRQQTLPWATRIRVAIDVASGLTDLHDKEIPIIHRDFKSTNILLDEEFNAKLSNYCYGKDDPAGDMTHASIDQLVFTHGYNAPENAETGHVTMKFNVYSFGVVCLELLSGRRARHIVQQLTKEEQSLVDWASQYLGDKRELLCIMDTRLNGKFPHTSAYNVAKIALKCLSSDPELRPTMAEVLESLQQI